ncbi:MAG TPA: hypothetical protein ENI76_06345 [Ignavibacteria bacterium]|nr:hypothetical protein [Ignavibacteria bacterium]
MINEKWKCKDKTKILISDMSNSHLNNTIAMLRRNIPEKVRTAMRKLADINTGEVINGVEFVEIFCRHIEAQKDDDLIRYHLPIFDEMLKEYNRREG